MSLRASIPRLMKFLASGTLFIICGSDLRATALRASDVQTEGQMADSNQLPGASYKRSFSRRFSSSTKKEGQLKDAQKPASYSRRERQQIMADLALENECVEFRNLIADKGYPLEEYFVTTEDGYQLALFRLPNKDGPPVHLQHGVTDSSWMWVQNLRFKAPAFALWDAGYDVWMGNNRGKKFRCATGVGANGVKVTSQEMDYTWDDMARQDVPAMIDFELKVNGAPKLAAWIGHSQGTTQFFVASTEPSLTQKVANRVEFFIALSPIAWLGNMRNMLARGVVALSTNVFSDDQLRKFLSPLTRKLPKNIYEHIVGNTCPRKSVLCNFVVEMIVGTSDFNSGTDLATYLKHYGVAGTSERELLMFAQGIKSKEFRRYDYGKAENMKRYNQISPPKYDLSRMTVPTALYISETDVWLSETDLDHLKHVLGPTGAVKETIVFPGFSHTTWQWGSAGAQYYIEKILKSLKKFAPLPPARNAAPQTTQTIVSNTDN